MTHDTPPTHLTEDERHMLADGSLGSEHIADADAHVRTCADCAADVNRIRELLTRANDSGRDAAPAPEGIEELWPSIRARIEQSKVVHIPGSLAGPAVTASHRLSRRWMVVAGAVVAAAIVMLWVAQRRARVETPVGVATLAVATDSGIPLTAVADSTHAYEEEAQALLNHLELRRATMRPELAQAFDRDMHVIDVAIAELQDAIARDPANPALRRLLASSYRQKVDLLKRVSDAS